ncbi:hypothetical protein [Polaribacter batillariae]|uniref:hypothetical protein n=1 Tax=Polaribacter batillariae TaxID=2808900 RepID=UPI001FB04D69|nr:hypothetical protein [Polaribacter batillariae]
MYIKAAFIIVGFTFLVFASVILGQIIKGKKLFEVVFFLVTYANINKIPFFDYFGAIKNDFVNMHTPLVLILIFFGATIFLKKYL